MVKLDAERITWFLSLQRILRFPQHFMAPLAVFRFGRKSTTSNPDAIRPEIPSLQSSLQAAGRTRRIATGAVFSILRQAIPSADGLGIATLSQLMTTAASKLPSGLLRKNKPSHLPFITSKDRNSDEYQKIRIPASQETLGLQKQYRLFNEADNRPTGSKNSLPLAPIRDLLPVQDIPQQDRSRFPEPAGAGTGEALPGRSLLPTSQEPSFKDGYMNQNQRALAAQNKIGDSDRPQHNKPAVSTIHMDGSVLGRWAIQYLERALGKPATGMTGVDPRATIPRSRVAPF